MTKDRSIWAVLFRVFGKVLVALVLLIAIPSALPRFMGYEVYNIVSGSMEPGIPVGSAAYVKYVNPIDVEEGQVIAFLSRDSVILHRVMLHDRTQQTLITKGDANMAEDMWPVGYNDVIGIRDLSVPYIGSLMDVATSFMGKVYLMCVLIAGVIFQLIAGSMEKKQEGDTGTKAEADTSDTTAPRQSNSSSKIFMSLFVILLTAFSVVIVVIVNIRLDYAKERKIDDIAADTYSTTTEEDNSLKCPKTVDFVALKEINPEIIGWLYCEGTEVDFPICATDNNDYYLSHAYDGTPKRSGSIFLEAADKTDFSDTNSVIYGHNMLDGSMFHCLEQWQDQKFYEEHDHMWLITPEKTYRINIFSGYVTDAFSSTYTVFTDYGELTKEYINNAFSLSDFYPVYEKCDILVDGDYSQKYVLLSTCAYNYKNARYVLHGKLIEGE